MAEYGLTWGDLDLSGEPVELPDKSGWVSFEPLIGFDSGAPVPVTEALARQLLDGEMVSGDRDSNRELNWGIKVTGSDPAALNKAEPMIVAEARKRMNLLTWTAPGPGVKDTVFETFRGSLKHRFDYLRERDKHQRAYDLVTPAGPYVRAASQSVVEGLTVGASGTEVVIDSCDSLTGWTGRTRTLSVDTEVYITAPASLGSGSEADGAYVHTYNADGTMTGFYDGWFEKTFGTAVDMSATPYLSVAVYGDGTLDAAITVDGVACTSMGFIVEANGWRRFTFKSPTSSFTSISIHATVTKTYPGNAFPARMGVVIDDLKRSNQPPAAGTGRQASWSIGVGGALRTPGSLHVSHATAALGDGAMIYTGEDLDNGYRPDLRRWRSGGQTVSTSSNYVSGSTEPLSNNYSTSFTARVPADSLAPGAYTLLVRVASSTTPLTATLSARARTMFGSASPGTPQTLSKAFDFNTLNTVYTTLRLGVLHLPPVRVGPGGSAGEVEIAISSSSASIMLDEAWIVSHRGVLTRVDCGNGSPAVGADASNLWVDSPSIAQPNGGMWVGTLADGSDRWSAGPLLRALGQHEFHPSRTMVFIVTPNAAGPEVSLTYYERGHSNIA